MRHSWILPLLACLCVIPAGCGRGEIKAGKFSEEFKGPVLRQARRAAPPAALADGFGTSLLRGFVPGLEWGVSRAN
jgi:hypothetical protein